MVDKKIAYSVKKAAVPKYYKSYLHRCINAWVGAHCERMSTGGSWINTEKNWHINALKLKSILLSLISIVKDMGFM